MTDASNKPTSEWEEFFNGHAPIYDDNCFTKNTVAEVDFIIDELKLAPGMNVLDVGCGTARHSIKLAKRGYRMTGVDISRGMLRVARSRASEAGVSINFILSDAKTFSLPDQFDAAICLCEGAFGLLGSADDPIAQPLSILQNIAASLKEGAPCLFTVLNGFAMIRRYKNEAVEQGAFDPLALAEHSECAPNLGASKVSIREKGFVPTEIMLLFKLSGLEVTDIWGGTAGNWGKRAIDLDEIEIMVLGRKKAVRD